MKRNLFYPSSFLLNDLRMKAVSSQQKLQTSSLITRNIFRSFRYNLSVNMSTSLHMGRIVLTLLHICLEDPAR